MPKEKPNEVYSLHRYIDNEGKPNFNRIFSEGDSPLWTRRHLCPDLGRIWHNQPSEVQDVIERHLSKCEDCISKYGNNGADNITEDPQRDLPF